MSQSSDGRSSVISAHNGAVRSVDVSADGNFILTGSEGKQHVFLIPNKFNDDSLASLKAAISWQAVQNGE